MSRTTRENHLIHLLRQDPFEIHLALFWAQYPGGVASIEQWREEWKTLNVIPMCMADQQVDLQLSVRSLNELGYTLRDIRDIFAKRLQPT